MNFMLITNLICPILSEKRKATSEEFVHLNRLFNLIYTLNEFEKEGEKPKYGGISEAKYFLLETKYVIWIISHNLEIVESFIPHYTTRKWPLTLGPTENPGDIKDIDWNLWHENLLDELKCLIH